MNKMSSQKNTISNYEHVRSGYCPREETERLDHMRSKQRDEDKKRREQEAERRRRFEIQKANYPSMMYVRYEDWKG